MQANKTELPQHLERKALDISESVHRSLRLLDGTKDWNERVKSVVVILSASRSGSSLIFKVLSDSEDIIAPAGEHEPWLFLSGNKFPFTQSDTLPVINNKDTLLKLIRNDLLIRESSVHSEEFFDLAHNRLSMRGEDEKVQLLEEAHTSYKNQTLRAEDLDRIFEQTRWNSTSNIYAKKENIYWPIENPPYINQPLARRATDSELSSKTLLFKSPSDAYRPGFYESLFPNAKITYIHLTRGFAQTVNGLMDGWTKDEVGFISNPVGILKQLNIKGYSDSDITKNYWCFDLFPDWQKFTGASLVEVCAQQWLQAHTNILANFPISAQIKFESFYTDRDALLQDLAHYVTVSPAFLNWDQTVMSTDKPSQFRWRKREDIFTNLDQWLQKDTLERVVELQQKLGYSMKETTWH